MSLKEKMIRIVAAHPKAATFGIGLAIVAVVAIGVGGSVAPQQAFALGPDVL